MQPELYLQKRELEGQHWWFQGRRQIVSTLLGTLKLPDNAKLFNLGCGTDGNLKMISGLGDETGAELDAGAAWTFTGRVALRRR